MRSGLRTDLLLARLSGVPLGPLFNRQIPPRPSPSLTILPPTTLSLNLPKQTLSLPRTTPLKSMLQTLPRPAVYSRLRGRLASAPNQTSSARASRAPGFRSPSPLKPVNRGSSMPREAGWAISLDAMVRPSTVFGLLTSMLSTELARPGYNRGTAWLGIGLALLPAMLLNPLLHPSVLPR